MTRAGVLVLLAERDLHARQLQSLFLEEQGLAVELASDGASVSPQVPPTYRTTTEQVPTGLRGLDDMLGGGLPKGRTTFIVGPTGSGKTTTSLQIALEGARRGEQCLYVTFEENPGQLTQQIHSLGANLPDAARANLRVLYRSVVELQIDSIIVEIFDAVARDDIRRVVIDGVGDLIVAANDPTRLHGYLYALAQHFAVRDVLGVELDGRVRRTIRIVKARNVEHELQPRELLITHAGVTVS